ncbi:MAG: EutN/CcmL family microcompartment protein [Pirellulales bacterium]
MRIAEVIGTVTLNRAHPSLAGASLRLGVPMSQDDLRGRTTPTAETLVVYDVLGAGVGAHIAVSEGREAAQPFHPATKPVDAYNAAILDSVQLEGP